MAISVSMQELGGGNIPFHAGIGVVIIPMPMQEMDCLYPFPMQWMGDDHSLFIRLYYILTIYIYMHIPYTTCFFAGDAQVTMSLFMQEVGSDHIPFHAGSGC